MPKEKTVSTYEVVPPDRSRYSYVYESDSTTKKYDSIRIGEKRYIRHESGDWEIDKSEPKYGIGAGSRATVKLLEKTFFNGRAVSVYEVVSDEYFSDSGDWRITSRYWLSEENLLLKTESEIVDKKNNVLSKQISIYDYDPNIKIEAPVIKEEQKSVGKP